MKKMMSFILLIMLLSAFATTTTAKSIYNVDNKASPPQKITAQESTQSTFDMPEAAALTANTAVTPFLIPWGCNEMCNLNETSATTGANKVMQYFLGPGDRLASAMLGGQRVLSNNDDNAFTNLYFAATELKNFLGPGDMPASGYLTGHNYEGENNEEMCLGTATELKNFLGPGDMCVLGSAEQNLYEITLSNNRGTCDNDVNVIRTPTGVTYRTGPGDHCRLTI